jgi:hypothetical protein
MIFPISSQYISVCFIRRRSGHAFHLLLTSRLEFIFYGNVINFSDQMSSKVKFTVKNMREKKQPLRSYKQGRIGITKKSISRNKKEQIWHEINDDIQTS